MNGKIKLIDHVTEIIFTLNIFVNSHKILEKKMFGKNFKKGSKILYESGGLGFSEGYFIGHVHQKGPQGENTFYYKILHSITGKLELCPIYDIGGYIE